MNLKENLGKNIQKYRKLNGITQEKLAEIIDVEINSISSIERGKYFPTAENLVKISNALNVKLPDLFTFKDEYNCEDLLNEINSDLQLIKNQKTKLSVVHSFVKNIVLD